MFEKIHDISRIVRDKLFSKRPHLISGQRRRQFQRKGRLAESFSALPCSPKERERIPEERAAKRQRIEEKSETPNSQLMPLNVIYLFQKMMLVQSIPEVSNYPRSLVEQLSALGVKQMATEIALAQIPLAGRLKFFLANWQAMTRDVWVLNCVQGYTIPFSDTPCQLRTPSNAVHNLEDQKLIQEEVQSMIQKSAIEKTQKRGGFISNIFLVPKKDGGQRPVINLKALNAFVETQHFKMEGVNNLKDFMIPICQNQRKFLKFPVDGHVYQFKCLPFGLACAPWVFTKTLRPVAAQLRQLGMRLIVYIDDILVLAESQRKAQEHLLGLVYLLENLGFVINKEKSILDPTQEIEFLGFVINSKTLELSLPQRKIKQIKTDIKQLVKQTSVPARKLSQLIGRLQAGMKAVPPAPLFYRNLQRSLIEALDQGDQNYTTPTRLSLEAREELTWWMEHLSAWNGKTLLAEKPVLVIESDASRLGWGAVCGDIRTGGPWTQAETRYHINCLEAIAAFLALRCFTAQKQNISVLLRIDNMTVVSYVNNLGGTVSTQLNEIVKKMWLWSLNQNIYITAEHLPGVLNCMADQESRTMTDRSDWKLNTWVFQKIQRKWGPLEVDLFASRVTSQLDRFFSWRLDPEAEGMNAFAQDWGKIQGRLYANPPWSLISKVLGRAQEQRVQLVLVAPVWNSQPWYPILLGMLVDYPALIEPAEDLVIPAHQLAQPEVIPQLAVWNISGRDTETKRFQKMVQNFWLHHGGTRQQSPMTPCLINGLAGAVNGAQIPFQAL
jgi:hypothetical protein